MSEVLLQSDMVLPQAFIENTQLYLDEVMQKKRDKLVILKDGVSPSLMLLDYEKYLALQDVASLKNKEKSEMDSKELGMLLALRSKVGFFQNLTEQEILSLVKKARFIKPKKHEVIFEQGDIGREVFFIIRGSVSIFIRKNIQDEYRLLNTLEEGSVFGEMAPILDSLRIAKSVAASENNLMLAVEFVEIPDVNNAMAFVKMAKNFIRVMSQKLIQTNEMVYNL